VHGSAHIDATLSRISNRPSLAELLEGVEHRRLGIPLDDSLRIAEICVDSREVGPSSCFVALAGSRFDGHNYLESAVAGGAAAAVVSAGKVSAEQAAVFSIPVIEVDDSREVLALLASSFHRNPAEQMSMIGITGTNGKTTVSYLIEQTLRELGLQTGVIGTIDYRFVDREGVSRTRPAQLTTPDPLTLQATLREMADGGVTHVIMEASSHALQQHRLDPIKFDLAVFTNLSQDHLDYHRTMEDYFTAKCLLFQNHMQLNGVVVVCEETAAGAENWSGRVAELCRTLDLRTLVCGESIEADLRLVDYTTARDGVSFSLIDPDNRQYMIESDLIGRFNVTNLHSAFAALTALGYDPQGCAELLGKAAGAPGRIDPVRLARPEDQPTVIVDYAHTPDALEKVLSALKGIEHRRLVCVFGCGGDRDLLKRPPMGMVAARLADIMIVTDDNPRKERPEDIRKSIIEGISAIGLKPCSARWKNSDALPETCYLEIGDRGTAIHLAVTGSAPEDIVVIAGKGHENYQTVGTQNRYFDDTLCVRQASLSWNLSRVVSATGGTVLNRGSETVFSGVSTDTRSIAEGDIFVALKGDVFDGHAFLEKAMEKGARCLVTADATQLQDRDICCVQVEDTLAALGAMASDRLRRVREISSPVVVGLTGSCGKTTVKEMTAAIFSSRWPDEEGCPPSRVLKTAGNFNNLIGLPLSLLPVGAHHQAVVLEMGMNIPGEIGQLTAIADPDICCITNVQQAHLEGVGSIEGVAAAKAELFLQSRPDSVRIINCDDEHILAIGDSHAGRTVGFAVTRQGVERAPEVWAEAIRADENGHLSFTLHVGESAEVVTIEAPGLHNASNCCAAAAICHAAGIDFSTIVTGLRQFRSSSNRMERLTSPAGLKILNDSYNANPASMASGLRTLGELPCRARMAVLGDMLELGEASADLHRSVGNVAAQSDLAYLGLVGAFADQIKQGALTSGMSPERIRVFADKNEVANWIAELFRSSRLRPGDWLLVKASRGLALDTVVKQIMEHC
jgi:murE/murF fusion protein